MAVGLSRRARWEEAAEWPLTGAAMLFLVAYAYPILNPDLSETADAVAQWVTWGTWALFGIDYLVRVVVTEECWHFVKANVLDLLVVVLPILRLLRLLRLVTMLTTMNRYAGLEDPGVRVLYDDIPIWESNKKDFAHEAEIISGHGIDL